MERVGGPLAHASGGVFHSHGIKDDHDLLSPALPLALDTCRSFGQRTLANGTARVPDMRSADCRLHGKIKSTEEELHTSLFTTPQTCGHPSTSRAPCSILAAVAQLRRQRATSGLDDWPKMLHLVGDTCLARVMKRRRGLFYLRKICSPSTWTTGRRWQAAFRPG